MGSYNVSNKLAFANSWRRVRFMHRQAESEDGNMNRITVKIEGMSCGMCEAHVCDTIRNTVPSAKKVSASRIRGEASFLTEAPVDETTLKKAIDMTGYTCLGIESSPYEKKGLFARK